MVSITSRLEQRWAERIRDDFVAQGSVHDDVSPKQADAWRRVARRIARELGRPVQTLAADVGDGRVVVHAILRDWPANNDEASRQDAITRRAVEAIGRP